MRRLPLCLALIVAACFNPDGAGTADTDEASTGTDSSPTSNSSPSMSSDPTVDTTSSSTMTTDQPTSMSASMTESSSGEIACDAPEIACAGECVDPLTTALHCGDCNHDCLGGECVDGACQFIQLASGKGTLIMLEPIGDDLYYGGDGVDIGRIGKDGSNDEIIAPAGEMIEEREWCYSSTNTGTEVLWGNDWVTAHWAVRGCSTPDCAGGVQQYVPDTSNIGALLYVPSVDRLFWDQDSDIHFMAWPGGADNTFVQSQVSVTAMAHDDEYLYWVDWQAESDVDIRRQNLDGTGGVDNMAINRPVEFVQDLAVGENAIYWDEAGDIVSGPLPNGIGTNDPDIIGTAGGTVLRIVVDDAHVYWTASGGSTGSVQRCPLDGCGGPPEILGEGFEYPRALTQDDVAVYWVSGDGGIYKIAK